MSSRFFIGSLHFGSSIRQKEVNKIIGISKDYKILNFETSPIYGDGRSIKSLSKALRLNKYFEAKASIKFGLESNTQNTYFKVKPSYLNKILLTQLTKKYLNIFDYNKISSFQLHAFNKDNDWEGVYSFLENEIKNRSVEYWGISNHSPDQLKFHLRNLKHSYLIKKLKICQIHMNLMEKRIFNNFNFFCNNKHILLLFNRVLARGILTSRLLSFDKLSDDVRVVSSLRIKNFYLKNKKRIMKILYFLEDYAQSLGVNIEHIAIKYCLEENINSKVILGVSNSKQLVDLFSGIDKLRKYKVKYDIENIIKLTNSENFVNSHPVTYFEK